MSASRWWKSDLIPQAKRLVEQAQQQGRDIPIPTDVVCGKEFSAEDGRWPLSRRLTQVEDDDMIFDIGPQTAAHICNNAATSGDDCLEWAGRVCLNLISLAKALGLLSQAIAASPAFSIAGGGDTLAAVDKYGIAQQVSYISTGGGAFLEFLEGKQLPAVAMLEARYQ